MKRLLSVLLVCLMLVSIIPVGAYTYKGYQNGDVNMSGNLSIRDATDIQKHIIGLSTLDSTQMILADVNLDEEVNVMDVTAIQRDLAKLEDLSQTEYATDPTTQPSTDNTTPTAPDSTISSSVTVYFTNNLNWSNVYFYLYDSATGTASASWPGQKITNYNTNDYGESIYYSTVDVSKYDRVIFNNGSGQQTANIPVNKASSGFFISDSSNSTGMLVGTYAYSGADTGTIKTTTLAYPSGYNKKIWIWTPADYSTNSNEPFKTIYIMDGQNLFDDDHQDSYGGWEVTDAVESMMANGGRGVIIVGIDNSSGNRDSELTPDLGDVIPSYANEFSNRTGEAFSNFVVNTVMPYVQANYNSSKAACDNVIAGSSSGGLEAFYIGMENNDKFGGIGALSPAFLLFSDSVWNSYLSKYNLTSSDMPNLYIFNGNGDSLEQELKVDAVNMYNRLVSKNYSSDKITLVIEDAYKHNEAYWRAIFPDMLTWLLNL